MRRNDEIETFKTRISLSAYAAGQGFTLDRKSSSRNSVVMRSNSDKVVIAKASDQHWIYFSVHDIMTMALSSILFKIAKG